jgi:hypothetical protein
MLAAHGDPGLLRHPGQQLRHAARPRLPRRLRRQPLLGRHRVELRVDPEGAAGLRARRLRGRQRRRLGHQASSSPRDHRSAPPAHVLLRHLQGGWRIFPVIYSVAPRRAGDPHLRHRPPPRPDARRGKPIREMLARSSRCGCGGSASTTSPSSVPTSPSRPGCRSTTSTTSASSCAGRLLTATFIFPASLLRPVGGWVSDRVGARKVMYWTFGVMLRHHRHPDDAQRAHRHQPPRRHETATWATIGLVPSPSSSSCSAAPWASARRRSTSTSPSTSPTTSAPSAAWSGCSVASAASSCRRCSPTPRSGAGFPSSTFFVPLPPHGDLRGLDALDRRAHAAQGSSPSWPDHFESPVSTPSRRTRGGPDHTAYLPPPTGHVVDHRCRDGIHRETPDRTELRPHPSATPRKGNGCRPGTPRTRPPGTRAWPGRPCGSRPSR